MQQTLQKLIEISGLKIPAISKKSKIDKRNLYGYNSGFKPIEFKTLKKIANSIGYDLEIIIKKLPLILILIGLQAYSQDTLCLTPTQYKNIYTGLKTGEQYRSRYEQAYNAAQDLNTIIQKQNDSLQVIYSRLTALNTELNQAHADLTSESVKIEASKPVKWWKHPITWGIIGFVAGVLTIK